MNKTFYNFFFAITLVLFFFLPTNLFADEIAAPSYSEAGRTLILIGISVVVIAIVAWLIIRSVKKKNNGSNH